MKKLERNEMKNFKGGIFAPIGTFGVCSATADCQNGSTVTMQCMGYGVQCTGIDYNVTYPGSTAEPPSNGYVYCSNSSGGFNQVSCNLLY
jgi:hypothetical protein